jgi:hypothetical protein
VFSKLTKNRDEDMNIKLFISSVCTSLAIFSFNAYAFNNGDTISFDPGVRECLIPDPSICQSIPQLVVVTKGSYFAMDLDGNGTFSMSERFPIAPGPDGGIVLGMLQPAPGIDQPWEFFGSFGMHQTTVTPVTQNPDGSLDFSGWEVAWNGIVVPLGSGADAMVSCGSTSPCTIDDQYHIDYTAQVLSGGFTGVRYQLHLENVDKVPSIQVSLAIAGGDVQECDSTGGHNVTVTADVQLLNGAQLDTIQWTVDGQSAGTGLSIHPFLSLGIHNISATATAITGMEDTANTSVSVVDSTAPVITTSFADNRSGAQISSIDRKNSSFVDVSMNATDICDASPSTSGLGGFALVDGDTLKIQGNLGKVELRTSVIEMVIKATDASGNVSHETKILTITP